MNLLLNIIWIIFGGWTIFLEYVAASISLMITVIGIPFGIQALKLSVLGLCPFGRRVYDLPGDQVALPAILNIIWLICGGIWIALTHYLFGALFYITIIGIPFGKQHFKLASLAMHPFGKGIVAE